MESSSPALVARANVRALVAEEALDDAPLLHSPEVHAARECREERRVATRVDFIHLRVGVAQQRTDNIGLQQYVKSQEQVQMTCRLFCAFGTLS